MRTSLRRMPQQLVGPGITGIGLVLLGALWMGEGSGGLSLSAAVLAVFLLAGLVLSYQFPIHLRPHSKVYMGSVPLYLMAALLPPPLAVLAAGLGIAVGNLRVRSRHALPLAAIASDAGRWMAVMAIGSSIAHAMAPQPGIHALPLIGVMLALWGGDLLTSALLILPISRERPNRLIVSMVQEGGLTEAAQYLVALLGAMASVENRWSLLLLFLPTMLVYFTTKHTKEMRDATRTILEKTADMVDMRDPYTGGHSRRVAEYTAGILRELPMRGPEAQLIIAAARVHDIGKIGIPDAVLKKDGRLSDEEWEIMKAHADKGADLIMQYPDFSRGVDIVRHHHERWDGKGYPHGLVGTDCPLGARVISVADSFDAMTSDRPYRAGMPVQRASLVLWEGRGVQWDPMIVEAFLRSIGERLEESEPSAVGVSSARERAASA